MFKGAGVAIVTPFKNGEVDLEAYGNLVEFHMDHGIQCMVTLGTTGEASVLSEEERDQVIILTYAGIEDGLAHTVKPSIVKVNARNRIKN